MGAVTALPWGRELTRANLDEMPDDGHRYELLDGMLLVSPAPTPLHQIVVAGVRDVLERARPAHLRVLFAPIDVVLADDTVLQPDVLVAKRSDFTDRDLPAPPLLAVEVLSPSTQRIDRFAKHDRYASAGVAHYWLVDPLVPSLTAYALSAGTYEQVALVRGGESYATTHPYPVSVVPAYLVADW